MEASGQSVVKSYINSTPSRARQTEDGRLNTLEEMNSDLNQAFIELIVNPVFSMLGVESLSPNALDDKKIYLCRGFAKTAVCTREIVHDRACSQTGEVFIFRYDFLSALIKQHIKGKVQNPEGDDGYQNRLYVTAVKMVDYTMKRSICENSIYGKTPFLEYRPYIFIF